MRLILATNHKGLDSYLKERAEDLGITIVKEAYFREGLTSIIRQYPAEAILLATNLPGSDRTNILDYIYQARMANLRVIVLTGERDPKDELVPSLVSLGVYDILFGEIKAEDIEKALKRPMTMSEIVRSWGLSGKPKAPPGLLEKLRKVSGGEEGVSLTETPAPEQPQEPSPQKPVVRKSGGRKPKDALRSRTLPFEPDDEVSAMTRPNRPVVAVWSPASTGKTFVSLHLSKALTEKGIKVALVDLDLDRQTLHQWLLLPEGEGSLSQALSLDVRFSETAVTGQWKHGLMVFSDDPLARDPAAKDSMVEDGNLMRFFNSPKVPADVLVCDLPTKLEPYAKKVLENAWVTVLVADQDYARCALVKESLKTIAWEPFLVLNRWAPFEGWDPKDAIGKDSVCNVPDFVPGVYAAIAGGGLSKEGAAAVAALAEQVMQRVGRNAGDGPKGRTV